MFLKGHQMNTFLHKSLILGIASAIMVVFSTFAAIAGGAVSVKAVMKPTQSIKMDFNDGSKHFVLMVRREGNAEGEGVLAGTDVTEYGWHDINPPVDGAPHGYLQFKAANGDIANVKWSVRAVFIKGEKEPQLADYGSWELVSGTGQFADSAGVGTLTIKPASETDRLYTLSGEIASKP